MLCNSAEELRINDCHVYSGLHGHLLLDGPQAFSEIECEGRRFSQLPQSELLRKVQQRLSPHQTLEEWITEAQSSRTRRLKLNAQLKQLR